MKKSLAIILSLMLLLPVMAMSVSALEYSADEPSIEGELIFDGGACENGAEAVPGEGAIYNFESGESYCCKFDSCVKYPITAPSDGTYTVKISYIARPGSNRAFDIAVDGQRTFLDVDESDTEQWVTTEIELTAGDHEFAIYAPSNMDDSELKSVDIYNVGLYLTKTAEAATEAPAIEAPATEPAAADTAAPVTTAAPQTSDIVSIAFMVMAGASILGIAAVSKKK